MKTCSVQATMWIHAPASAVQAVYADVANWHLWDPDTRSAHLDGPFQPGSAGRLRPRKGLAVRMRVTEVTPDAGFTVECPVLGSRMRFEHVLAPHADGVTVLHRVCFSGYLAAWLMRFVGRELEHNLPVTLSHLKAYVESSQRSAGV